MCGVMALEMPQSISLFLVQNALNLPFNFCVHFVFVPISSKNILSKLLKWV